jgi:hypothetical protein
VELNPITHLRRPEPKTWSTSEKKAPDKETRVGLSKGSITHSQRPETQKAARTRGTALGYYRYEG